MVAISQGAARRDMGRPKPSHSSITSTSRKSWWRATSTVTELTSMMAVLMKQYRRKDDRTPVEHIFTARVEVAQWPAWRKMH